MSTIIKFDIKELKKLANDKNSCIIEKKVTQNLALQPWCLGNLKESIKNLLDYKIGKFDKEFNGILLSYKNLRVLQNVGTIRNDNADIHFQVQADYFIFRPFVGATLTGIVNKKSTTHLGILVHRVFNVVIPRPTEEPGNMWVGSNVQEGQEVRFRIEVLDLYGALPYIRGELDVRCVKLGPDGDDDEEVEKKATPALNVSYVDFDKTKPYSQKQIGDGLLHSTLKNTKLINSSKHQLKIASQGTVSDSHNQSVNGKSGSTKAKNVESEISVSEKKTKRQSKLLESEQKQPEAQSKPNKKHKRDVQ
ncbi:DNA-directed RNA polymerase I subunit RPA43 [Spodoptera litura]|uniref:DNA-directed RNA polymerase I subunit RPA43 n=1 Tax=Spodoptera litura TaxID=69820 RepID=A0A9J7EP29_SPOLT|nr:DNA-directed RNA polymerase I subunit RPA43 [Spodoptera litura]